MAWVVGLVILRTLIPPTLIATTPKQLTLWRIGGFASYCLLLYRELLALRDIDYALHAKWGLAGLGLFFMLHVYNLLFVTRVAAQDIPVHRIAAGQSTLSRILAALLFFTATRGIGSKWQIRTPPASKLSSSRYLLRQLMVVAGQVIFLQYWLRLSDQIMGTWQDRFFIPLGECLTIPMSNWEERIFPTLAVWVSARLVMDIIHRMHAIVFVCTLDFPQDWPPLFGSVLEAYTLRNFWGKFWHQTLRWPLTSLATWVTRDILGLTPSSLSDRYLQIFLVFGMSDFIHLVGAILGGTPGPLAGIAVFFAVFPIGIMIEDGVQELWRRMTVLGYDGRRNLGVPTPGWQKLVGYCWVFSVLYVIGPLWAFPLLRQP